MAVYKVKAPDGNIIKIQGPDGASEEEIIAQAQKIYQPPKPDDPAKGSLPFRPFGIDTGLTMSEGVSQFAAGAGKSLYDLARGAGQVARDILPEDIANKLNLPTEQDIAESRRLDEPLMKTGPGFAGNITGYAIPFAATSLIPGANTYTGAGLTGAISGALQPTAPGESRGFNVATGTVMGLGSQLAANFIGKIGTGIKSALNPEQQKLAQELMQEGVPLSAADVTGSKTLKQIDAALENIPSTSGGQLAKQQAKQAAYNAVILKKAGIAGDLATPDVLVVKKAALGKVFEDIASRNSIDLNNGVINDLIDVTDNASKRLIPDEAKTISNAVDEIMGQTQNGILAGTNYQGWRSELGRLSKGNDSQAHYFGELKKALDNGFNSQISGQDAAAWKQASRQYGNLKTIAHAMGGSGIAPSSGDIAPSQLAMAASRQVSKEGKALGRGDLTSLAKGGSIFLNKQIPDSGTAQRMLAQALLTGGGGYALTQDPTKAVEYGLGGLALPYAIRGVLYNPAVQRAMVNGVPAIANNQALIQALMRGGALTLPAAQ